MKVAVFGAAGKVGQVLCPALGRAGHDVVELELGDPVELDGIEAMVDFTAPDAVEANVRASLEQGVACVVGTTGLGPERLESLDQLARERGRALFVAPNFSIGAVLMMRFAAEAAGYLPRAEIIEMHNAAKKDAPSGTAKATAELIGPGTPIHSVRLPGLVAHQEVLLADDGQLLTIRHDTLSREAFVPGVLLALERLPQLPPGLTFGLDALLGLGA